MKNKYAVALGKLRWEKYKGTEHEKQRIERVKEGTRLYWAKKRAKISENTDDIVIHNPISL